jgi:hypothetical protein
VDSLYPKRATVQIEGSTMNCPKCGNKCWRDEADVGVGVIYGPYGCPCGWSESREYDQADSVNRTPTEEGWTKDQWGGLNPPPIAD